MCPPWFSLGVEHVAVEFNPVDLRIVPLYTVRGLFAAAIVEHLQEVFVAANFTFLDEIVDALIVVDVERNIPGLVISPTVVGHIQQVGLKAGCGCHCGSGGELVQCSTERGAGAPPWAIRWRWCPCSPRAPGALCLLCSPAGRCAPWQRRRSSGTGAGHRGCR